MPNWTFNTLEVRPMEHQLDNDAEKRVAEEQFKDFVKESINLDEGTFTLGGVCPMPESLNITSGTTTENGMAFIDWVENNKPEHIDKMLEYAWLSQEINKKWSAKKKRDEACKLLAEKGGKDGLDALEEGRKGLYNLENYGYKDWYGWCCANWGTKWDVGECEILDYDKEDPMLRLQFDTAWSPPMEWLQKATEKYPFLQFCMHVEEESEAFCGKPVAQFGRVCENLVSIDYPERSQCNG